MVRYDLEDFVGEKDWVLVSYIPFEGQRDLAWINIVESTDGIYKVFEADSFYFEGDITSENYRFIGGSSTKRHIICDEKIRSKEEIRLYEPFKKATLAEVLKE